MEIKIRKQTKLGSHDHFSCPLEHLTAPPFGILVRERVELHTYLLISVNQTSKLYLILLTFNLTAEFTSSTQGLH